MKFMTVEIQVYVKDGIERTPHTVRVEMTMGDRATAKDAADKLGAVIQERLELVDIGDCT